MGLSSDILKWMSENIDLCRLVEYGDPDAMHRADVLIVELNVFIHNIPTTGDYGHDEDPSRAFKKGIDVFYLLLSKLRNFLDGARDLTGDKHKILVIVNDVYDKSNKKKINRKNRHETSYASIQRLRNLGLETRTDDELRNIEISRNSCPPILYISAYPELQFALQSYLATEINTYFRNYPTLYTYFTCPSLKNMRDHHPFFVAPDVRFQSGDNIRISAEGPLPPLPFEECGEGDLAVILWLLWVRYQLNNFSYVLCDSIDSDLWAIAHMLPREVVENFEIKNKFVELKRDSEGAGKRMDRYVQVVKLFNLHDGSHKWCKTHVLVWIFSKNDFCRGFQWVGFQRLRDALIECLFNDDGTPDMEAIERYVRRAVGMQKRWAIKDYEEECLPIVMEGLDNIEYWLRPMRYFRRYLRTAEEELVC